MGNQPLRIAMMGHKRVPSREGGIEIVVEELSVRLVRMGQTVICYNRSGHHISGAEYDIAHESESYRGVRLKSVFTIDRRGLAAMTASVSAALRIALSRCDVAHFHAEGPCAMLWLPKLFGKKCVVTIHGLDWQRSKWGGFASRYIKFGERTAARHADEIIVLSKGVQQYFRDTYGRNTCLIPNGVSRPVLKPPRLIRDQYGLHKDGYVLFLGRIVPEKGIQYLLEAWKSIKTDKKLVIAGGSSDTEAFLHELKDMTEGDTSFIFTGFVQGEMLEELYSNAYVYCLPSDLEGMPLSLLEAMSYGNCCLTSDIPECADVVEDHGVTFPKGNVRVLRDRLQMLLDDTAAVERCRASAADYICQKYSWDYMAEKTLDVYRHLSSGKLEGE